VQGATLHLRCFYATATLALRATKESWQIAAAWEMLPHYEHPLAFAIFD
jgi:hypothetical protein